MSAPGSGVWKSYAAGMRPINREEPPAQTIACPTAGRCRSSNSSVVAALENHEIIGRHGLLLQGGLPLQPLPAQMREEGLERPVGDVLQPRDLQPRGLAA